MKTKQQVMMAALALCVLALLQTTAQADPVSLTISPPNQSGVTGSGSVLTFMGTFTNLGPPAVTIMGGSVNFLLPVAGLAPNVDGFENNFLGQTVGFAPGSNSITNTLFTITVGAAPVGTFTGQFTIVFDGLVANQEIVGLFSVTVLPSGPQPIPEPATMMLLGSGLAGLAAARRRRRKQQPPQQT